jgi:Rho-binding antiterminator
MMDQPYAPISCAVHDELLALATLRRECGLAVAAEDGTEEEIHGIIADVYSRGGAEYLELRGGRTTRLDRIRRLKPVGAPFNRGGLGAADYADTATHHMRVLQNEADAC